MLLWLFAHGLWVTLTLICKQLSDVETEKNFMSRHSVTTTTKSGDEVSVVIGYDRPLKYVFCTVNHGRDMLYSNMDDMMAGIGMSDVRYYEDILAALGIRIPEVMYEQVEADQDFNIGNRLVTYAHDGTVIEELLP
jgi:hypothetical protein